MTSTTRYRRYIPAAASLLLVLFFLCAGVGSRARADDGSLSVTVTPPLYQLTIGPGDSWTSTLKIINSNRYDVTFYARIADMHASGEDGRSKFTPVLQMPEGSADSYALARWIRMSVDPIVVAAGASQDVPFTIHIPQNAEPGGHYAAILVGTEPGGSNATGSQLKVSSFVSSLLFVRIRGEVIEKGRIREFITARNLYQTPQADFLLRFENMGNTHVKPEGQVTIYNMWGRERGSISINQGTDFGNVLPKTVRRFEFSWRGEEDLFDIGLYSAVVTLAFGESGKQNVNSTTYFWVVPVVPVAIGTGSVLAFIFLLVWFIRRYIRRALELEQRRLGLYAQKESKVHPPTPKIAETLIQPIKQGVIDLRSVTGAKKAVIETYSTVSASQKPNTASQFIRKYRLFWVFIVVLIAGGVSVWLYFSKVLVHSRGFQITDVRIQEELPAATTTPPTR